MAAGGHFGFGPLTEFTHTFTTGTQANFFYLTFIDDKSIEKTTSALNGRGIAGDDPTNIHPFYLYNILLTYVIFFYSYPFKQMLFYLIL